MKTKSIATLLAPVLAICALLMVPVQAAASDDKPLAEWYEQDVPEQMRTMVTLSNYENAHARLDSANARLPGVGWLDEATVRQIAASPCSDSLLNLVDEYVTNPKVPKALAAVLAGMQDPPVDYGMANPWKAASSDFELLQLLLEDFTEWCTFLPEISGDQDNGLAHIQHFAWFYYQNQAGKDFVQGRDPLHSSTPLETGLKFVEDFSAQRGAYMSSPASTAKVRQWVEDPRIEIEDYQKTLPEQYSSWNDFFAREITIDERTRTIPSRPATMPLDQYPKRDYIVVSPTDCIMNPLVQFLVDHQKVVRRQVDNPLQYDTVLDVKGIPISLAQLLEGVPERYRRHFVGGTGLSCVLMPNTYHHFHSPVNGTVVHAQVLDHHGTFGYIDWPNWVPVDGNVGRPGTDFSQFDAFERGIVIIEVKYANVPGQEPAELTGYVASIPVGLDTIGSVILDDDVKPGLEVKRGYTRLGNFLYGGSLDILLFSEGLATGAVQTRLGNQIGILNVGTEPEVAQ